MTTLTIKLELAGRESWWEEKLGGDIKGMKHHHPGEQRLAQVARNIIELLREADRQGEIVGGWSEKMEPGPTFHFAPGVVDELDHDYIVRENSIQTIEIERAKSVADVSMTWNRS